jgi:rubredoxin
LEDAPRDEFVVRCTACGLEMDEAEAQAQRWGYWHVAVDLYPFCPDCAKREFNTIFSDPIERLA